MKSPTWKILAIGVATWFVPAAPAGATVLSFDDLSTATAPFVSNYGGFTFGTNNAQTTVWLHSTQSSSGFDAHSGTGYVITDGSFYGGGILDDAQAISRATAFIFDGAWFTGVNQVHYSLYNGSTLVFQTPESAELSHSPTFVASGYSGLVTSVVIAGPQGHFAMDDFTFTSPVPEPSTFAMTMLGLLVLGSARWQAARRRGRP